MASKCFVVLFVAFVTQQVVLAQFSPFCRTPNNERGTCIPIRSCPDLVEAILSGNPERINYARLSQCGHNGRDPLVCCSSSEPTSTEVPFTSFGNSNNRWTTKKRRKNGLPGRDSCGYQAADKILNGEATGLDEFPWMVLIQYRKPSGSPSFSCGGSLISSKYVLTAGHCVAGPILRQVGTPTAVRLGEWNTNSKIDCVNNDCNDAPLDVPIDETIPHPNYNPSDQNNYHDIALIKLRNQIQYTDFIKPICLPSPNQPLTTPGNSLYVAGWGHTENGRASPVKLKLEVPAVSRANCERRFSTEVGVRLRSGQICAGGVEGSDSCRGDSGGPLMNTFEEDAGQWYLEGIVSFGLGCGLKGWPGVYTNVQEYLGWIEGTVRE